MKLSQVFQNTAYDILTEEHSYTHTIKISIKTVIETDKNIKILEDLYPNYQETPRENSDT